MVRRGRRDDALPDPRCRDAVTGTPTRLFEAFAGPHFILLGFGPRTAVALREGAALCGDVLRTCPVDAGPKGLLDDGGGARSTYGAAEDTLVLVRPDDHVGLIAPADGAQEVLDYLRDIGGRR